MSHPTKHYAIVNTSASFDVLKARESLDAALILASYDLNVSLCFIGDGVFQSQSQQEPERIGAKDFIASMKALHFYDIEQVFVSEQCLIERGLSTNMPFNDVTLCALSDIRDVIDQADVTLVF
ncbi:sulfurtransferase complex subunit TusC [Thalassotalea maritima]|uniref:sulfurtransferase complex subunit TusC n=1 Tax=Thalassotalea maritima TaxID=3242416 RepID=UPI0035298CA5